MTIHLKKISFFAYHGVHEEEQIIGNNFELNIAIDFNAPATIVQLTDTINYVAAYEIVKKIFAQPQQLLETVAQNIAKEMYNFDNRITSINISIDKLHAPILNFTGIVGIVYSKSF